MTETTSNPIGAFTFKDLTKASQEHDSTAPEFQEFENLTDKLLRVPKKELDEKREEEREGS